VLPAIISGQGVRAVGMWGVVLFVPQVISVVVVGVAWQWLLDDRGPVNQLLRAVGLGGLTRVWLGDFTYALPTEGVIGTWMMSGLCMVLMLAAAQSIDPALYDAASVDGAGRVAEFFAVTLPGLRRVVIVCSVLTFAVSLNNFGLVWVTTQGGPGNHTQVLSTVVYTRAFVLNDLGMASALAIILGVLMMGTSFLLARRMDEA
jgi:raffinose/stachyose/melibiose transport system permease protein